MDVLHDNTPGGAIVDTLAALFEERLGGLMLLRLAMTETVERFKQEEHQLATSLKTILQLRDEERAAWRAQLESANAYARQLEAQLQEAHRIRNEAAVTGAGVMADLSAAQGPEARPRGAPASAPLELEHVTPATNVAAQMSDASAASAQHSQLQPPSSIQPLPSPMEHRSQQPPPAGAPRLVARPSPLVGGGGGMDGGYVARPSPLVSGGGGGVDSGHAQQHQHHGQAPMTPLPSVGEVAAQWLSGANNNNSNHHGYAELAGQPQQATAQPTPLLQQQPMTQPQQPMPMGIAPVGMSSRESPPPQATAAAAAGLHMGGAAVGGNAGLEGSPNANYGGHLGGVAGDVGGMAAGIESPSSQVSGYLAQIEQLKQRLARERHTSAHQGAVHHHGGLGVRGGGGAVGGMLPATSAHAAALFGGGGQHAGGGGAGGGGGGGGGGAASVQTPAQHAKAAGGSSNGGNGNGTPNNDPFDNFERGELRTAERSTSDAQRGSKHNSMLSPKASSTHVNDDGGGGGGGGDNDMAHAAAQELRIINQLQERERQDRAKRPETPPNPAVETGSGETFVFRHM